jgi:hypothetical protein
MLACVNTVSLALFLELTVSRRQLQIENKVDQFWRTWHRWVADFPPQAEVRSPPKQSVTDIDT